MVKENGLKNKYWSLYNQELITKKWRLELLLKLVSSIIYGCFFGMLPTTFLFNKSILETQVPIIEICSIVGLLMIGIFSLIILFWTFRGDIKKMHPIAYSVSHIINSLFLSIGIILTTIFYPDSINSNRYFVLGLSYLVWSIVISLTLITFLLIYRLEFPLTLSKLFFSTLTLLLLGLIQIFIFFSKTINDFSQILLIIALSLFFLSLLIFGFGIFYIKRFRDSLISEKTDDEITIIQDWEISKYVSIIISSVLVITYSIGLLISNNSFVFEFNHISIIFEFLIDLFLIIPYIITIIYIKLKSDQKNSKNILFKFFRRIDNWLLLDILSWFILVKTSVIQGIIITLNISEINIVERIAMTIMCFSSIFILYSTSFIFQVNIPNLKNKAISSPTIISSILLGLFIILFSGYLSTNNLSIEKNISNQIFVLIPVILILGLSISLIIKISMISIIMKDNKPYLNLNKEKTEDVIKREIEKENTNEIN